MNDRGRLLCASKKRKASVKASKATASKAKTKRRRLSFAKKATNVEGGRYANEPDHSIFSIDLILIFFSLEAPIARGFVQL